ncbi:hypothetical protein SAMN02982917_6684 [Azospirillum oryzae]|uniref:Uncharacterized protein n=2 Tax=Azospirillum oryzae TaxID=286727 RepID=A0A1X7HM82_9PROT|nr:hypothetical protein SAMN02982917_6684 [Azospirillum oryzae]
MLEGERYGPFLDGQVGALIAAVQAANHAGKDGHDARVLLRAKNGCVSTAWIFGTESYPSRTPPSRARNPSAHKVAADRCR